MPALCFAVSLPVGLPYENGTVTPASLGLPDSDIHDGVYTHEDRGRRWTDPKITRPSERLV